MATTRITKVQYYTDIMNLLEGKDPANNVTVDMAIDFCKRELELLSKKSSGARKPTATQKENEDLKVVILAFLGEQGTDHGFTCTELQKSIAELEDFTNQKIAALMNALTKAGVVRKESVKNKTLFFLV